MSDVSLNFTVNSFSTTITANSFPISIDPSATQLTLYTGGAAQAGGSTGQIQYNNSGIFGGISTVTSNGTSFTISNVNNLKINGGSANTFLKTDGAGNISFASVVTAPGGSNTQLQYNNNGSFAGMPNVTYTSGVLALGDSSNVKLTGGTNGYVLQTDGTGNLTWTAQTGGGGGNGTPGGANTQVQFNDSGDFGGNSNFTFNKITNTLTIGNIVANGAGLTNLTGANVTGTVANATYAVTAGAAISVAGANVTGQVANAIVAGTVYSNAQPNINSVGTLTSLNTSGSATIGGALVIQEGLEQVTANSTGATGTITLDVNTQSILLKTTAASANFTLNVIGNSTVTLNNTMSIGQSLTCTLINTISGNAYIANTIQIDSITQTVYWNSAAPSYTTISGTAKDVYTFNIIKTSANTYTVLGSTGRFA